MSPILSPINEYAPALSLQIAILSKSPVNSSTVVAFLVKLRLTSQVIPSLFAIGVPPITNSSPLLLNNPPLITLLL